MEMEGNIPDFKCIYCRTTNSTFDKAARHCISEHGDCILKIGILSTQPENGKQLYRIKNFQYRPNELSECGKIINVVNDKIVISTADKSDADSQENVHVSEAETTETPSKVSIEHESCDIDENSDLDKLVKLMPDVAEELKRKGLLRPWVDFHELISKKQFPLDNLSFRLFLNVVEFLSTKTTTQMRYSKEIKEFWYTGYKLFHGKFLRFMSGPKNQGSIYERQTDAGLYTPQLSKINFAVPDLRLYGDMNMMTESVKPGVIPSGGSKGGVQGVRTPPFSNPCISWDIHLTPPLLLKYEDRCDLNERETAKFLVEIQELILRLSVRVKELRQLTVLKSAAVTKFKKMGEPNWKISKYLFVISSIQASLFQIKECIEKSLITIDELGVLAASLQNRSHLYVQGKCILLNMNHQENHVCIGMDESEEELVSLSPKLCQYICKQPGEAWKERRKTAMISGSTAYKALGLETLKEQNEHIDVVANGKERRSPSADAVKRMAYGSENEKNAKATLVGKVLPIYYPRLTFVEEGCYSLSHNGDPYFIVSPDGSGRNSLSGQCSVAFEFKCPFPDKMFTTQHMYKVPTRYSIQLLCEMSVLRCQELLFLSYTEESTAVFRVTFDESLWNQIEAECISIYGERCPKRLSRRRPSSVELKGKLVEFLEKNVTFLGEVPSVKALECSHSDSMMYQHHISHISGRVVSKDTDVAHLVHKAKACFEDASDLSRRRASELFVFLASDLDRFESLEKPHSVPVAYGLQGPSLKTHSVRKMLAKVMDACKEKNLYPIAFSSDGQWINIVTKNAEGKSLTMIQKQKEYWEDVNKQSKQTLLKYLENYLKIDGVDSITAINNTGTAVVKELESGGLLVELANPHGMFRLAKSHLKCLHQQKKDKPKDTDLETQAVTLLPDTLEDKLDSETYREVLNAMTSLMNAQAEVKSADNPPILGSNDDDDDDDIDDSSQEAVTQNHLPLNDDNFSIILDELKTTDKWKLTTLETFKGKLSSVSSIKSSFTVNDLKICYRKLKQVLTSEVTCLSSAPKWKWVNAVAQLVGLSGTLPQPPRVRKVLSLKKMSLNSVKRLPKALLSVAYAEVTYSKELEKWKESFLYSPHAKINNTHTVSWYSFPDTVDVKGEPSPVFGIIDSHHILTNLRAKCCSSGMHACGIKREAWLAVAKDSRTNKTGLTVSHVEDLVDKQSNSFAKKTFCESVENVMLQNGDLNEANFCKLIRNWYDADDEPAIDSVRRLEYRLNLRAWLLKWYNPLSFPPPKSYVAGIPIVTYESLLTNIERKIQIYQWLPGHSCNPRTLSTLDAENFFSLIGEFCPGDNGCIRPKDIPTCMRTACELNRLRFKPERLFFMKTSKKRVYPVHEMLNMTTKIDDNIDPNRSVDLEKHEEGKSFSTGSKNESLKLGTSVTIRNHAFDVPNACSSGKRKRKSGDISDLSEPSRGAKGVRQFHKCDESKILPHRRLGISDPETV